jgi:hypothetical protein
MSLDPGSRIPSPLSSGRSSPQPRLRFRNDDGENTSSSVLQKLTKLDPTEITRKDPKYRRYSATIDRALSLFETYSLQEWADYISFLGRLLKVTKILPRRKPSAVDVRAHAKHSDLKE